MGHIHTARVRLGLGTPPEIEVGGQRIEAGVQRVRIEATGRSPAPEIELELTVAERVEVDGTVTVAMTPAVRAALIALGWTPPED